MRENCETEAVQKRRVAKILNDRRGCHVPKTLLKAQSFAIEASEASGADKVYHLLRQAIMRHELAPGEDLDEVLISARFHVSRTPVREALIRLTAENLVTSVRGRGARVAAMNLANLRDFFEGLDVLQRALTRLAALRRTDEDLAQIRHHMLAFETATLRRDIDQINEVNYAFHAAIGAAAQSGYMHRAYLSTLVEGMRLGHVTFGEYDGVGASLSSHFEATIADHRAMLDAIGARETGVSEEIAGRHVDLFRDRIVATVLSLEPARGISAASLPPKR